MTALVTLLGAATVAGIVLVIAGFRTPPATSRTPSRSGTTARLRDLTTKYAWRLALGLVGGMGFAALTGVTVMVFVVPIAVIGLPMFVAFSL